MATFSGQAVVLPSRPMNVFIGYSLYRVTAVLSHSKSSSLTVNICLVFFSHFRVKLVAGLTDSLLNLNLFLSFLTALVLLKLSSIPN